MKELAKQARKKGLAGIALTDQACVDGIPEMIEAGASAGIHVIPGVEIRSNEGVYLGYFVDYMNPQLLSFLEGVRRMEQSRIKQVLKSLDNFGLQVSYEELTKLSPSGLPTQSTIARVLVKQGLFPDTRTVFNYLLGEGAVAYHSPIAPDADTCIEAIQDAGGIVVEAHPHITHEKHSPSQLRKYYALMKRMGVVGYERMPVATQRYSQIAKRIKEIAHLEKWIEVRGSDFQGDFASDNSLGSEVTTGDTMAVLMERLPEHCLYKNWFERMRWRCENLMPEEFRTSLRPREIRLKDLEMFHLIQRPPLPTFLANAEDSRPFVLIGPGMVDQEGRVKKALQGIGATILSIENAEGYSELAWDLFGTHLATSAEKERALLYFNLERRLHPEKKDRGRVIFFEPPQSIDLKSLKNHIRRQIGTLRFYRVRYKAMADICFTAAIHIPESERIPVECHCLREHGIRLPCDVAQAS
jgi:predicted metal-dependent phosphoesterase TrpH